MPCCEACGMAQPYRSTNFCKNRACSTLSISCFDWLDSPTRSLLCPLPQSFAAENCCVGVTKISSKRFLPDLMAAATTSTMRPWRMVGIFAQKGVISVVHHLCTHDATTVQAAADFTAESPSDASAAVGKAVEFALAGAGKADDTHSLLPEIVVMPDLGRLSFEKTEESSTRHAKEAELYDALVQSGKAVFVNPHESCLGKQAYYNYYNAFDSGDEVQAAGQKHVWISSEAAAGAEELCTTPGQAAAVFVCRRMPEDIRFMFASCAVQSGDEPPHHPRAFVDNYGFEGSDWVARWSWAIHGCSSDLGRWLSGLNLTVCNAYDQYADVASVPPGATAPLPAPVLPAGVALPEQATARMEYAAAREGIVRVLTETPKKESGGGVEAADLAAASHALLACARMPTTLRLREGVGRGRALVLPGDAVDQDDR